ncbi:MAG: hypothetical protein CL609_15860 [Anaerolineaceae bacterium]|nr:hypothetical protein [Anaerolineaceae bacterium]
MSFVKLMSIMQQTLGTYLKKIRKSRNLSLEEVSFSTKIKIHYLEALEEDEHSVLPSRVQGKGFLRLYADFLNLDEKRVITAWEAPDLLMPGEKEVPSEDWESKQQTKISEQPPKQSENFPLPQPPESDLIHIEEDEETTVTEEKYIHFDQKTEHKDQLSFEEDQSQQMVTESKAIFIEIGQILQENRQSLHLTLEEIEQYTNIRVHYLKALESGNLESLPSPVQGRGMLSNYAKFLNLNHEELLLKFANGLQLRRTEQLSPEQRETKTKQDKSPSSQITILAKKYLSLDFILTIVLIIGVFGIIIFAAAQIASPALSPETTSPPSISDVLLESTEMTAETTPTPTLALTSLAVVPVENGTEETGEETPIPEGDLPLQLYVISRQRAFLRITADDEIVFDGRTIPGNAYEFSAENQIELLTGNAGALEVYFNQESLGSLGSDSEVVSLLFTLDQGFVTPTPRVSPTPTNTQVPTATITPTPTPTQTIVVPTPTVTPFIP